MLYYVYFTRTNKKSGRVCFVLQGLGVSCFCSQPYLFKFSSWGNRRSAIPQSISQIAFSPSLSGHRVPTTFLRTTTTKINCTLYVRAVFQGGCPPKAVPLRVYMLLCPLSVSTKQSHPGPLQRGGNSPHPKLYCTVITGPEDALLPKSCKIPLKTGLPPQADSFSHSRRLRMGPWGHPMDKHLPSAHRTGTNLG